MGSDSNGTIQKIKMGRQKNIVLIVHDNKKRDLL
jgi:hypothetical protein